MKVTRKPLTPILDRLMAEGKIHFDGKAYRGIAADGQEVHMGCEVDRAGIEAYLTDRPNPSDW